MGDLFHALPAVHDLKAGLQAEVDWVVNSEYVELVKCFPDVGRVIPFHRRAFFQTLPAFVRNLRQTRYDLIVDLQGLFKSGVVTRLANGAVRLGPSYHREGSRIFYDRVATGGAGARHAVDRCRDTVTALNLPLGPVQFPVRFPEQVLKGPRPYVGLIPFSRWATKNWPAQRFSAVGMALHEKTGGTMFVMGGKAETVGCGEIASNIPGAINLCGMMSLVQTGGTLAGLDLLVANDTGPLHMAVAAGTPVVAIYGATRADRTGPYDQMENVLSAALACQPCWSRRCRRGDLQCMMDVEVSAVVARGLKVLNGT
jgi:ADP-heptose:LPS heptosyltransferase